MGIRAGRRYVDTGTLHGYRAAIRLLERPEEPVWMTAIGVSCGMAWVPGVCRPAVISAHFTKSLRRNAGCAALQ